MQISFKSFAAGAAVMLLLGTGSAVAATGGKFITGRTNTATTTTTIKDTKGTPLSLVGKSGRPPLTVNSNTKVARLNADLLDGRDSSTFMKSSDASKFALANAGTEEYTNVTALEPDDLNQDGTDDSQDAVAFCPAHTIATGVSIYNPGGWPVIDTEIGDSNNDGIADAAIAFTSSMTATADDFGVWVDCLNPRGKVAAQKFSSSAVQRSAQRAMPEARVRTLLTQR